MSELNVLALLKSEHRYIVLYDDSSRVEALKQFGRWAADKELAFTWYDAAVLSQRLRTLAEEKPL